MQDERTADADLVRRCVAREPAAWDALVHRHVPVLSAAVRRVLGVAAGVDVEDVLQAVYLRLWDDDCRRLRTFQGRSRLSTWLVVLARREALDRARARRARRETATPSATDGEVAHPAEPRRNGAAASSAAEEGDERRRLLAAVDALPARERLLVRLVWMDDCPYADAARLLAVPENSISPWLLRARGRLREALAARTGGAAYGTPAGGPPTGRSETP